MSHTFLFGVEHLPDEVDQKRQAGLRVVVEVSGNVGSCAHLSDQLGSVRAAMQTAAAQAAAGPYGHGRGVHLAAVDPGPSGAL
ncbi:MAG: hypothetical protein ACR2KL_07440 [Nocardioidaceae bacterium]